MNISILPLNTPQGLRWQVSFITHSVTFRSEAEARQFVATLQARLQAPHPLPAYTRRAVG
ncbi:hypothetical protein SAMN05216603_107198 [Pseudomonas benzenivorans]|nr:hypothetical protein [Pseudomonas benzenivorans]SDH28469.1 hypothetical protein SAMN05216603_107198 [Pseudomonas benzenivorans]